MASKRKFIIDCDVGTDDAQAIMMALVQEDVELVAVTAVFGNAVLEHTSKNSLRVLKVCGALHVPVFRGCDRAVLGSSCVADGFHGFDGMGDTTDPDPPDYNLIQTEHAVTALVRLVNENPGAITLVAIGPLTNIAMAIRMDPKFGEKLKDIYIMGGNTTGKGNVTATAEFNFWSDPEGANIVLCEIGRVITLAYSEICEEHFWSWDWYDKLTQIPTAKARYVKLIDVHMIQESKKRGAGLYAAWDQLAMAVAINKAVAIETKDVYMEVECRGSLTRGQCVVDWRGHLKKAANVRLLTKIDKELYSKMIFEALEK